MFFRMVLYDVCNGILKRPVKWFVPIVAAPCLCAEYYIKVIQFLNAGFSFQPTLGDQLFSIISGIPAAIVKSSQNGDFPIVWFLLCTLSSLQVLDYPLRDLHGFGQQVLVHSKTRMDWWFGKCIWVIIQTAFFFVLFYTTVVIVSFLYGADSSLLLSDTFVDIQPFEVETEILYSHAVYAIVLPIIICSCINLVQLLVSFIADKKLGFLFSVTYYAISIFVLSPMALGNYAMLVRWSVEASEQLPVCFGVVLSIAGICTVFFVGGILFRRYDILQKEVSRE